MLADLGQLRISNDTTLSDDEIRELRAERRRVQAQLEALRKDDTPPEADKKTKKRLQGQLSTYDALLAPHKLLPAELLSHIFIVAYPSSTFIPVQHRNSPLVLCQVCSRWRSVALATPELWTDVVLRLAKHTSRRLSPDEAIDAVRVWFGRSEASARCTISLVLLNQLPVSSAMMGSTLQGHSDGSDDEAEDSPKVDRTHQVLKSVLDRIVVPFAPRFRDLQLTLPAPLMVRFIKHTQTAFPELRRLSLSLRPGSILQQWTRAGIHFKPVVVFGRATSPLLVDVTLVGFHCVVPTQLVDVGWANVTRLELWSVIGLLPRPCYSLLKRCRRLEECKLEIDLSPESQAAGTSTETTQMVHLPHLRSLTLEFYRARYGGTAVLSQPEAFFAHLACPALSTLIANWPGKQTYERGEFAKDPATCPFLQFLARSDCGSTLEVFESDMPKCGAALENVAVALPRVVEFRVKDGGAAFNGSLEGRVRGGRVLRRVKVLVVRAGVLGRVLDMVEGRWGIAMSEGCNEGEQEEEEEGVARLEYLMVEHEDAISRENAARIDALRRKGVEVQTSKVEPRYQLYE